MSLREILFIKLLNNIERLLKIYEYFIIIKKLSPLRCSHLASVLLARRARLQQVHTT